MICRLDVRLQTMDLVIEELARIAEWERKTPLLAVTDAGVNVVARLRQNAIARSRARDVNAANRMETERRLAAVSQSVLGWLRVELSDIARQFGDGTALRMEVCDVTGPTNDNTLMVQIGYDNGYRSIGGIELSLREAGDAFHRCHRLQILLCREWQVIVTARVVGFGVDDNLPETIEPPRDVPFALIPMYRRTTDHDPPGGSVVLGYLSKPEKVGTRVGHIRTDMQRFWQQSKQHPRVEFSRVESVTRSFHDDVTQCVPFRLSEWPTREAELRSALGAAVGSFLDVVSKGALSVGL